MFYKFRLELWNKNKYKVVWEGTDIVRAGIMFNKSYNRKFTRRLIKVSEEILYKDKAKLN